MKQKKSQSGSAHVVIIAVLAVAFIAMLGVVFYQNFIAKKSDDSAQTNQPLVTAPSEATTRVAFNSSIYDLDYPKNWKVTTKPLDSSAAGGSLTTLANQAGTVSVTFTISEANPSNTCDLNDGLKISSYHIDTTPLTKLTGASLYLVEAIIDSQGGGYQYSIGLTQESGDTHAAIGDTHCNVVHVGQASFVKLSDTTDNRKIIAPTILAKIEFPKLPAAPRPAAKDMQQIKDSMATSDYKAAVKILESARKE